MVIGSGVARTLIPKASKNSGGLGDGSPAVGFRGEAPVGSTDKAPRIFMVIVLLVRYEHYHTDC